MASSAREVQGRLEILFVDDGDVCLTLEQHQNQIHLALQMGGA
jgi:hypothetical protein